MAARSARPRDKPWCPGVCGARHLLASGPVRLAGCRDRPPPTPAGPFVPRCLLLSKTCPACGTGNRPIARFCKQCATPLEPAAAADGAGARAAAAEPAPHVPCADCGAPNRAVARFCRRCGLAMVGGPQAGAPPLLRQPDRGAGPARAATTPAAASGRMPRQRLLWQLLFLVGLLAAAVLWWQRGSAPPPAADGPVEEFLDTPSAPAPSASQEPAPEPAAEPLPPALPSSSPSSAASAVHAAPAAQAAPRIRAQRPATAPPAPPAPAVATGPDAACADSNRFTHSVCLGIQCLKDAFRRHPTCVRLDNEARQRRQRESEHGLVGG